ncbi:MAG: membrane protein insertase YidC [Bacteroidota bacterium]
MLDRNALIGMSLMLVMMVMYYTFFAPETKPESADPAVTEQVEGVEEIAPEDQVALLPDEDQPIDPTLPDSVKQAMEIARKAEKAAKYADFAPLTQGEEQFITVTTDKLVLKFSSKGGKLLSAHLNNHETYDSLPLPIFTDNPNNQFYFEFAYQKRFAIRSDEIYFSPSKTTDFTVSGENEQEFKMVASLEGGRSVEQIYTIKGNAYDLGYSVSLNGFNTKDRRDLKNSSYQFKWVSFVPRTEKAISSQREKTAIAYMQSGEDLETMGGRTSDTESEFVQFAIDWISFKSQFFSHIFIADEPLSSAKLEISVPPGEKIAKIMKADMTVEFDEKDPRTNFTMYLGPNEYDVLNKYDRNLEDQMDLGYLFISQINIGTIYVFKFLEKYISNYGLIILIFAILVKLIVFPLTYKSYVSMAKLRVINETDEIKSLDEKHKDDPQKQQMAKMNIYRQMGASPFGGCLPMILQYPILISMFFFFPQSVELRHKSFLWADDLSTYDSVLELPFSIPAYGDHVSLFTLLMAVSIYIYTYYQQKSQPTNSAMPMMKYIPYAMPIIFVIFLNNYASGLSWYYFASNIISIIQTTAIRASLDDEKLLTQMRALKKKSAKKGKNGKSRMERWMDAQQKKQEEVMKQRRGNQSNKGNRNSRRKKK